MNMRLVRFTKGLLDIMFYVGMAITAAIPLIFHYVGMYIETLWTRTKKADHETGAADNK